MVVPIATYCSSLSQSACPTAVTAGRHSPGRAVVVAPTPSFSAALGRQALAPVADREEMTKIAPWLSLDPYSGGRTRTCDLRVMSLTSYVSRNSLFSRNLQLFQQVACLFPCSTCATYTTYRATNLAQFWPPPRRLSTVCPRRMPAWRAGRRGMPEATVSRGGGQLPRFGRAAQESVDQRRHEWTPVRSHRSPAGLACGGAQVL